MLGKDVVLKTFQGRQVCRPRAEKGRAGKALVGRRDRVVVATKFGILREPGAAVRGIDGSPDYVRASCEASLKRLGVTTIDLYYQHRVDPKIPIEETVGAMAQLVEQGEEAFGLCAHGGRGARRKRSA